MRRLAALLGTLLALLGGSGCSRHFEASAAPGFVVVDESSSAYDWRAVAPDGVVVAVRVVKLDDGADLPFWAHTIGLRMREEEGYALLSTTDVRATDGTAGKELLFGHDESGKQFVYRVRLYLVDRRLTVVEAGGIKEQMERYAASVAWMLSSVRVT
jgi:hypothetical protein